MVSVGKVRRFGLHPLPDKFCPELLGLVEVEGGYQNGDAHKDWNDRHQCFGCGKKRICKEDTKTQEKNKCYKSYRTKVEYK